METKRLLELAGMQLNEERFDPNAEAKIEHILAYTYKHWLEAGMDKADADSKMYEMCKRSVERIISDHKGK